ncbi:MAG: hypothetical protein RJB36_1798, partial [Bacteroidota bacterium]
LPEMVEGLFRIESFIIRIFARPTYGK